MPVNLSDLVRDAAASRASHPALVTDSRTVTWAELDRLVHAVAGGLTARGVRRGDRVAMMLGNSLEFAVAYFGILRAGAVAVPLNTAYTPAELAHIVQSCEPVLIVADEATAETARSQDVPVVVAGSDEWRTLMVGKVSPPAGITGPEDLAVLLFTAGTSGNPKGVMLSHRALVSNLDQLASVEDPPAMTPDDVTLAVLPLFHVYGLNAVLGMVARLAGTAVLVPRFDPATTLAAIRRHRVTNVAGAPPMFVAWSAQSELRESLERVRLMVSGSAPLLPEVAQQFATIAAKPVWEGYGMTEAAPVITSTLVSGRPKPGSVGQPLPGVEIELRDEDGEVAHDEDPGEIFVRGPNLFSGYWPDGDQGPDADGWFGTGDVGVLDADGDLFLVDRRGDLILVSGFNVYPREVEKVISAMDEVAEVAVTGVPHPYTGEAVRAIVVPVEGREITGDEVLSYCETRLARFKCPTIVDVVTELPHSVTGKVAKGRIPPAAAVGVEDGDQTAVSESDADAAEEGAQDAVGLDAADLDAADEHPTVAAIEPELPLEEETDQRRDG